MVILPIDGIEQILYFALLGTTGFLALNPHRLPAAGIPGSPQRSQWGLFFSSFHLSPSWEKNSKITAEAIAFLTGLTNYSALQNGNLSLLY
jgi:hypothetical protein